MTLYLFGAMGLVLSSGLLTSCLTLACIAMVILIVRKIFLGVSDT